MNRSESIKHIVLGLIKARPELLAMEADKKGQRGEYIGRDELLRSVNTILAPYGMQVIPNNYVHPTFGLVMKVELHHAEGEWISSDYTIENHVDFSSGDVNWKKGGSITYGIRYTIGAMLGITIGDDDYKPQDHTPKSILVGDKKFFVNSNKPISDAQKNLIVRLFGADKNALQETLNNYEVKSLDQLNAADASEIISALKEQ